MLVKALRKRELDESEISLRGLWEAFVGPVEETIGEGKALMRPGFHSHRVKETVNSAAFSIVTGNIILTAMMKAYEQQPSALDQLVTQRPSRLKQDPVAGFQAFGSLQDTAEGDEYEDSTFTDKYVMAPEPKKRGRMIKVTEEAVIFDQTNEILNKARAIGQSLQYDREFRGMNRIQDQTGYEVYYPADNGVVTQTALFRSTAAGTKWFNRRVNKKTTNALSDWTNVDAAMTLIAAMDDEENRRIVVAPNVCLVPYALYSTALRIFGATEIWKATNTAANTTISPNVVQRIAPGVSVLQSPFMADSTTWYLGDFKSQFFERVIIPPQVNEVPANPKADMLAGYVCRHKTQVEAVDDCYVIQNTSS
jgi:hypothetical protein